MATEKHKFSAEIEAAIEKIHNIQVSSKSQVLSLDELEDFTRLYTDNIRPGTYLVGSAKEEEELASRGGSRQIDDVEFDTAVSFGFPDEEEDDSVTDDTGKEPIVELDPREENLMQDEDDIPIQNDPDRTVVVNGEPWHIADYLGKQWVDMIMTLHSTPALGCPEGMLVTPFDYQLKGAAQMDQSLEGPFKFFFLGDRMGMGKTLTTTLALWLKKDEPGMALVVAPASVCAQWVSDVHRYFDEEHGLRAFWLHDSRLSATWLLSQGYDIVVVTYEFLETSLRPVQAFKSDIEAYVNATRAGRKKAPLPKRPTSALFSPLWKVIQRPWKRTILDEAQNASKRFGKRHQGILHLPTTAIACLSGTAAHNKWTAFSGYLNFMKAIPWTSHSQFMRTFCGSGANPDTPGFIETRLLQRMLQNTLVARPLDSHAASKLHGLVCWAVRFSLDDYDSELVRTFTSKYKEETAKQASSGYGYSDQGRKRDGDSNAAMGWASKARCAAAHPLLLAEIPMKEKRKDRASASGAQKAKPRLEKPRMKEKEDIGGQERQYWLQLVERDQFLEQHSARIRAALAAYKWCRQQYPDEKIAMCSLSLKFLDILAVVLKRRYGIDAVRFDGTTPALKRKLLLRKVETGSADVPLLMTAGCGGVGINLAFLSCLIQLEPWWNMQNEEQYIGRGYRIQQRYEVKYFRLEADNSEIDEEMIRIQLKKKTVIDRLMADLIHRHDEPPRIRRLFL